MYTTSLNLLSLKGIKLLGLSLVMSLVFNSCSVNTSSDGNTTSDKTGKEYTSAYICPMHCEGSGSEAAGACPVCGMDYVKNEEHKQEGHEH